MSTKFRLVILLLLSAFLLATSLVLYNVKQTKVPISSQPVVNESRQDTKTLQSSMLFVGEVFWGRAIERYALRSPLGTAFPFSGLTADDKKGFDAWFGDMECPITSKDIAYKTQVDDLLFNCRPEYTTEAAKWFTALSLANNHTNNNGGTWGMTETRNNLAANKIQYFGDYNMAHLTDICDVIAVPAQFIINEQVPQVTTIPIALCGYDYVGGVTPKQEQYDVMKQYAAVMPVIAMPHMGIEYRATAEDSKVAVYRALIDNGADVVIGAHPHVVQNSENYKGRLIQYSTGNFMFDQQTLGYDTVLSLGVSLAISVNDKDAVEAYQSATNCDVYHDDCLAQLAKKITKRPVIAVTYSSRCFEQSSNIPKKADQATCDDILKRATWQAATSGLSTVW